MRFVHTILLNNFLFQPVFRRYEHLNWGPIFEFGDIIVAGMDGDRAQVDVRGVHHPRVSNKGRRFVRLGAAVQRAAEPLQPTQGAAA